MKKFTLVGLSILILAATLTGCAPAASAPAAAQNPNQRTINVNGTGSVTITPDIAYITIGVHTEGADVSEALASNTQQAKTVSDALSGLGVEAKDIQTTAFNVYPSQQYGPSGEMLDLKYVVDNSVYITVRDLNKMGQILSTVVSSGANNISGIQFDVADRSKAETEARQKAVNDARAQAEELSAAAGAKLGKIQFLSANVDSSTSAPYSLKSDAAGVGGNVPVSAGQLVVTAYANVTYELE
jgi:uncharacterized protein